ELREPVAEVTAHALARDAQALGEIPIRLASHQLLDHLSLTGGQDGRALLDENPQLRVPALDVDGAPIAIEQAEAVEAPCLMHRVVLHGRRGASRRNP